MLAITALIPLLLSAVVSASPFTTISIRPAQSGGSNITLATSVAPDSQPLITAALATGGAAGGAAAAAAAAGLPPPEHDGPRPTQPPQPPALQQDLRVNAAGFAVSSSPASTETTSPDEDDDDSGAVTPTTTMAQVQAVAAQATEAPPANVPEADADLARLGYSQTTYYACETFARATHCGWHVPVVEVSGAAAAVPRRRDRGSGNVGGVAAGAAVCGMLVSWAMRW